MEALVFLDKSIFEFINSNLANPLMDWLMKMASSREIWIAFGIVVTAFAIFRKNLNLFLIMTAISLGMLVDDTVASYFLKPFFGRIRPCKQSIDFAVRVVSGCAGKYSFPSNHAANAMTAAALIYLFKGRRYGLVFFIIALLIGFSRIYLGVHYPGDVLGGFVFGGLVGLLVYSIIKFSLLGKKQASRLIFQTR